MDVSVCFKSENNGDTLQLHGRRSFNSWYIPNSNIHNSHHTMQTNTRFQTRAAAVVGWLFLISIQFNEF